jgi:hypothetical protein
MDLVFILSLFIQIEQRGLYMKECVISLSIWKSIKDLKVAIFIYIRGNEVFMFEKDASTDFRDRIALGNSDS